MQNKAKVIAFSGIDGCGKSTQLKLVKKQLSDKHTVFISRLSYMPLNDMGKNKFQDIVLEGRSFFEILKHYIKLEKKEIRQFDYILCDRHLMCYLAYAYAYGIKDVKLLRKLLFFINNPDLTLYFDIEVNESLQRIYSRNKKVDKQENYDTLLRAKNGYEKLLPIIGNVEKINANGSIDETSNCVNKVLIKHGIL